MLSEDWVIIMEPTEIYAKGVQNYSKAQDEGQERAKVLIGLYDAAVGELGVSRKQLQQNDYAQKTVLKRMFEMAEDEELNPLLKTSNFYKGFSKDLSDADKSHIHMLALGANYDQLVALKGQFHDNLDFSTFSAMMERGVVSSYADRQLDMYLSSQAGIDMEGMRNTYAAVAAEDANIGSIDTRFMDVEELKNLAKSSIKGQVSRGDLEERVGIELPAFKWAA